MPPQPSRPSRPSYRLGSFLLLLCCAAVTHARAATPCAPPSFNTAPVIRFSVASSPASVAAADYNRDGRKDLAVTTLGGVAILLGAGDGTFLPPRFVPARDSTFPVISTIEVVVAGDFNGDGAPDLAVSWNADEISVLLGRGDGTFGAPSRLVGGGTGPTFLSTADLNADGKLDLILTNANSKDVSIFLGNGAGGFAGPTRFPAGFQPDSVVVGEFNGDGKLDLAVAGGNVYILLGDGAGGFGAPTPFQTADFASRVAVADFNSDGKSDLVVGHFFFNQISVLFGTGNGTFTGRLDITTGKDARFVSTGDFNRDGKADILALNRESDDVVILTGDGAGHFGPRAAFVAGYGPIDVAASDFNGDGETDLATVNIFGGSVSVLLGKGGGAFAAAPSLGEVPHFGSHLILTGDFNNDGKPDVAGANHLGNEVWMLPGDGAGGFGARVASPTLNQTYNIASGHLDGDGKLDLVTIELTNGNEGNIAVYLANGDGTFRRQSSLLAGTSLSRLVVADFNNDGKADVAVSKNSDAKVAVLLGDGAGNLSAPNTFNVGSGPQELVAADFNNDGKADLAVVNYFAASVSILLGNGAGGFAAPLNVSVGSEPISVAAADFNGDGRVDLAVVGQTFAELVILTGNGNGTFAERSRRNVGFMASALRTGDFNGDGAADIAVALNRDDEVALFQGDGVGNFAGPFSFYVGSSPVTTANADFNGDGRLDLVVGSLTIVPLLNTLGTGAPTVQLCPSNYSVGEGVRSFQVLVSRGGDTSGAATVAYTTQNNTATDTGDYSAAVGTLRFAPGEVSKSFPIFINDDAFAEPVESFNISLTEASGAKLGQPTSLSVNINDNETSPGPNPVTPEGFNPLYFVRQHYVDFLNREPDEPGLNFWVGELNSCGTDARCAEVKRINVSAAFFLSIEFQETGYLVYRTYKTAYGDATSPNVPGTVPVIRLREFLADTQRIGAGVVVGQPGWGIQLETNKSAYLLEFVQRPRFLAEYPRSMALGDFINKLVQNSGAVLNGEEHERINSLIRLGPDGDWLRADILKIIAESQSLRRAEFNRAFVLMQYYGYLRRDPDTAPEPGLNFGGWKFWLDKLNEFNGDYIRAEMVKAFITSDEYRKRFGQ